MRFWLPNPVGLVAILLSLDRSLNQLAAHVLLLASGWSSERNDPYENAVLLRTIFILNLADCWK
jgi:hypothetical protein